VFRTVVSLAAIVIPQCGLIASRLKKTGDFVHPKNYDLINEVAFGSFVVESGP
jgi:hypothetical protein